MSNTNENDYLNVGSLSPILHSEDIVRNIYSFFDSKSLIQRVRLVDKAHKQISNKMIIETSLLEFIGDLNTNNINVPVDIANNMHFLIKRLLCKWDNYKPMPPLSIAAALGSMEAVKLALSKGADINYPNHSGKTALFYAGENNHIKLVEYLLDNGADISHQDEDGNTLLNTIIIMQNPNFELFKFLLNRDEFSLKKYNFELSEISSDPEKFIRFLPNILKRNKMGLSPLVILEENSKKGDKKSEICLNYYYSGEYHEYYISRTDAFRVLDYTQEEKLENEAKVYFEEIKRIILQNNSHHPNGHSHKSESDLANLIPFLPKYSLRIFDYAEIAKCLIKTGAHQVLQSALENNIYSLVCNYPDHKGNTLLHLGLLKRDPKLVGILLNSPLINCITKKNKDNQTPLELAKSLLDKAQSTPRKGYRKPLKKIINYLTLVELACQQAINKSDKQGNTPLHLAAQNLNFQLIKLLIANGASLNFLNENSQTPLDVVKERLKRLEKTCEFLNISLAKKIKDFLEINEKKFMFSININITFNNEHELIDDIESSLIQPS